MTTTIEKSIEVGVPVHTAYDQWTQFETFPEFMEGVESVRQLDDTHVHWKANIGGVTREWDAEIVHQIPDDRITWRATEGAKNEGTVSFRGLGMDKDTTEVTLRLEYDPEGLVENVGELLNVQDRRAKADLERFKEFIEARGTETGGWRGEVRPGDS